MRVKAILCYFLALLFKPFPRNKNLWVTGKITSWGYDNSPPDFFDNSKYFFLYLVNNTNEKVFWLSSSKAEINLLKSMNLPVVKYPSIKGMWLTLRAGFFFHHYGTDQINSKLQLGATQINFWHAMPFKKMRYSVVPRVERKLPFFKTINEYALSSSRYLSETVCSEMYGLPLNKILNYGFPRQDILCYNKKQLKNFCNIYSRNLLKYIDVAEHYDSVLLYMPTWRDDDPQYFSKLEINYFKLCEELGKINGVLFLKLHPLTRDVQIKGYDNIIQIDNSVDIYPFLPFVDYLITDYSSICYDYLLLDREMVFIPYDIDKYLTMRGLYFDYNSVTPGEKYYSFNDFIYGISTLSTLNYKEERKALREKFFDDFHYNANQRTYKYFKEMN